MISRTLILFMTTCLAYTNLHAGFLYLSPDLVYQALSVDKFHYDGLAPKISVGYGTQGTFIDPSFYFGAELFWEVTSWKIHETNPTIVDLKPSYSYGFSLVPGVVLDSVLLGYLRFGIERTRFNNYDTSETGYQIGIGLQAKLTSTLLMRAEYDYIQYKKFENIARLKKSEVALGVIYQFC